ncbi:C2H2 type zinc finger domain protein [Taphrina deformans PYCC 5710]|uniref:C2H2 type zinc finger domain protein n=1 Tax=Taphrina deformans (strain PYCC 5710 / ATCC 11124 / CBS 356.35 / IMI 108563 / JCM 9778 / NBRC 8474) TaxID=1097556 RepID=R4XAY8_TAPDE|nr:C2H2 type zinc finger domain protein [Taphrina deformans PYCC 5710]|eukprot:CCG82734.1 C2H2 type zinc finger domain protein [Taphrina deformans PYCC 5710]
MDYNNHHGDVSMQPPQPIVFGYQPTLNGALNHDSFMYGSRPGSRYASRAPSPSHDFDAQFENTLPAASVFGFLFKDSARDLPSINAILPRLLPVPGFATDFPQSTYGHNGADQPGTYSNYRNDTMSTSNSAYNLTRPSSPVLSFQEIDIPDVLQDLEDGPLVDQFTETDRTHLQEYTQTQLPSARLINIIIQLYFDKFHECMPIVHRPNYSPGQTDHILTLAIMAVGSQYIPKISLNELHRPLVTLANRVLKLEQETFAALQAQFLLDIADLYNLQSQGVLEAVEDRRNSLQRKALARKLFDENYDDSPPEDASTEARWQILRRAEERRRLSWGIWLHDHLFSVLFGVRPLMEISQVRTSLPCHESLWEPNTAREWAEQFAPDRLPLRTRTLWSTGRLEDRGATECLQYGLFCRTILAHVEARRVLDLASAMPVSDPAVAGDEPNNLRKDQETVLANARELCVKALDVLEHALRATDTGSDSEISDAQLHLHFARLATQIDLQGVRKLLSGDDRGARSWAEQTQSRARAAVLSAAHITELVSERQPSPFAGMFAFYSTMTLFCFVKFSESNESLQQLQLDKQEFGSTAAQQWIDRGSFIPMLQDIGLLDRTNVSRIVKSWQLSEDRIAWWGLETLKDRVESLSQFI